jgi:DNA-binding transcriptional LysR family regulator
MNTLFFKYAVEIERTRSISKAAENLFMAQPNLSKAIKELELEVGFSIFKRNSKGVVPTEKGFEFLAHAKIILEEMTHIKHLTDEENPERQSFSISIPRASTRKSLKILIE